MMSLRRYGTTTSIILKNKSALIGGIEYHYTWLRDNCQCCDCIHPGTKQKLHSSGQIKPIRALKGFYVNETQVMFEWPVETTNGQTKEHTSVFHVDWLKRFDYSHQFKHLVQPKLWQNYSGCDHTGKIDYIDFSTDLGFKNALRQIRDFGLCFLKNVPTEKKEELEEIALKFGTIMVPSIKQNTFYGPTFEVKSYSDSKNIAYTSLALPLHMDLLYFEAPPGLQLLHCIDNTVTGGHSLFLDSFAAVERLKTEFRREYDILTQVPLRFCYENDGRKYEFLRPTIAEDLNDGVKVFYSPPFQGPIHCDPAKMDDFYEAFAVFESIVNDKRYQYRYLLQKGDVALFQNRRVLHGREAFHSDSGKRWLRGTYVCWDDVKNSIRVNSLSP